MNNNPCLFLTCFLIFIALSGLFSGCGNEFPSKVQINDFFANYRSGDKTEKEKIDKLTEFLKKLSKPENVEHDANIKYAIDKLIDLYRSTDDEAILIAVDNTEIDGGFANYICEFYKKISKFPGFGKRYSDPFIWSAVSRCVGC